MQTTRYQHDGSSWSCSPQCVHVQWIKQSKVMKNPGAGRSEYTSTALRIPGVIFIPFLRSVFEPFVPTLDDIDAADVIATLPQHRSDVHDRLACNMICSTVDGRC